MCLIQQPRLRTLYWRVGRRGRKETPAFWNKPSFVRNAAKKGIAPGVQIFGYAANDCYVCTSKEMLLA